MNELDNIYEHEFTLEKIKKLQEQFPYRNAVLTVNEETVVLNTINMTGIASWLSGLYEIPFDIFYKIVKSSNERNLYWLENIVFEVLKVVEQMDGEGE